MHIRCPHCRNAIEVVADSSFIDMECPSCGTHFSLASEGVTGTYLESSQTIGRFELLEQVGMGQYGSVWKAKDTELDRIVAVKIPRQEVVDDSSAEQFMREARAAAQISHSNIVPVHEVGREDGRLYIVSDFIEGANLAEWIRGQQFSPREAAELCESIAEALHAAHEAGVTHRDLKPSNIMMSLDGKPFITDFGLAKREAGEITVTVEGRILGTPAYMPPEQAKGEGHRADRRSDVYSLGVILYELLTGERPFRGDARMLLVQIQREEPQPPRKLRSGIPRDLETVCLKCLEKKPDARYSTAAEVAAELRRWQNNQPIEARPISSQAKLWRWCTRHPATSVSVAALAVGAMAVFTALAIVVVQQNQVETQRRENDRKRADSLVRALMTAPAEVVPYAIDNLSVLPQHAAPILREQLRDKSLHASLQLRAAVALAEFGEADLPFLIDCITHVDYEECPNIQMALAHTASPALGLLREASDEAKVNQAWRDESRFAIASAYLGDWSYAVDMCELRDDPERRVTFIDEFRTWHCAPELIAESASRIVEPDARSGICLAIGGIPKRHVTQDAKKAWIPLLSRWYDHSDTGTHGAASWTMRQWGIEPNEPTETPHTDGNWHINSLEMTMLIIPPGSFSRGVEATTGEQVTIPHSFFMSDREVSHEQFMAFLKDAEYPGTRKPASWETATARTSSIEDLPVRNVSWYDAVLFCNWFNEREGLDASYERVVQPGIVGVYRYETWIPIPESTGYRLPSENEWEYACRAKTSSRYISGNSDLLLHQYAVYGERDATARGTRMPNSWGLFDLLGNVSEWCQDAYGRSGVMRVHRGGGFDSLGSHLSSSRRVPCFPDERLANVGFRVVRTCPRVGD